MTDQEPSSQQIESDHVQPHRVHVIINPAAGQDQPTLGIFNRVFQDFAIDWELFITKDAGDARQFARSATNAGADLVIACGGDGTVTEAADGLRESRTPLAILPCGTANVMAIELGIPRDFETALRMAVSGENFLRPVDMAMAGSQAFLLRAGTGIDAKMVIDTPREAKNRLGNLAYVLTALNEMTSPPVAQYRIILDHQVVADEEGIMVYIANSASVGVPGVKIVQAADISDGLLDVILVRPSNLPSLLAAATNVLLNRPETPEPIYHWQAKDIRIEADPPQPVEVDGEAFPDTPFHARVLPQAVKLVSPPKE